MLALHHYIMSDTLSVDPELNEAANTLVQTPENPSRAITETSKSNESGSRRRAPPIRQKKRRLRRCIHLSRHPRRTYAHGRQTATIPKNLQDRRTTS